MSEPMGFDAFRFDTSDGRLEHTERGVSVTLRPQVARLLETLLARRGEVIDRDTLRQAIWGEKAVVDFEAGMAALMSELRKALVEVGAEAELVETIPRRGYRFRARPVKRELPVAAVALSLVVLGVVGLAAWGWLRPVAEPVPERFALAILPYEVFDETERGPAHAGLLLPDALLARFWTAELADITLIGRASLRPYTEREDVAQAVAEDLGVHLLIEGTVVAGEVGWQVRSRLLRMPHGQVLWSQTLHWPETGPLPISAVADRIIGQFQADFREISEALHGVAPGGGAQ